MASVHEPLAREYERERDRDLGYGIE